MGNELLVNPQAPFKFYQAPRERYHLLTFAAMVAGKSAMPTARKHTDLLTRFPALDYQPDRTTLLRAQEIGNALCVVGTGKYNLLGRFFSALQLELMGSGAFLLHADREMLTELPGIGMKSASFYVMYTKPDARVACLDVHILKYLRSRGVDCPEKATPSGGNRYRELEWLFLDRARELNVRPWVLDIYIWSRYNNLMPIDDMSFRLFVKDLETNSEYRDYVRP